MKLNICSGNKKLEGFTNVDIIEGEHIDIVWDLNKDWLFTQPDTVETLVALDAIEHLHDRIHTMNEIWKVCKDNAQIEILVPSTDGRGAFQDPTHVSYWNINSFMYYTQEHPAYLDLCKQYGFKGKFKIDILEDIKTGDNVIHTHAVLRAVKC